MTTSFLSKKENSGRILRIKREVTRYAIWKVNSVMVDSELGAMRGIGSLLSQLYSSGSNLHEAELKLQRKFTELVAS